jgi:hypothetical protein
MFAPGRKGVDLAACHEFRQLRREMDRLDAVLNDANLGGRKFQATAVCWRPTANSLWQEKQL